MSSTRHVGQSEGQARVRILGDICIDGQSLTSQRIRALLVRLALAPGDIVSEDSLMEALWPDGAPRSAKTALQTHIGALRDLLEPERVRRHGGTFLFRRHGGYMLDLGEDLDVSALRRAVERAETMRATQPSVAASLLDAALELWHPGPLCEFKDAEWAAGHATTFQEYATRALVIRMELALDSEEHADVIPRLEAEVATHPYNEQLVALLMTALHRSGRQADALAAYQHARHRLVEELGVEPGPGLRAAEREVLTADGSAPKRRRIAAITDDNRHFVGRTRIQAELRRHLGERSLVTLVGPGGVGKSRLALRVVAALALEWDVEAVFVDLCDVGPGQAASAIASRLGVVAHPRLEVTSAILAAIERQDTLLVLDTCEHLLEDVAAVVDALLEYPNLRILATSRSPLGHRNELIVQVQPLATDDSISLLLDRAGLNRVSDEDRLALGEVCRRLDGLPLAIELAAGRLRSLTPRQLSQLLVRGRAELRGGDDRPLRHRSLAETIAWSYELLDEPSQRALRQVAVLRGAFTEAAAASFWHDDHKPKGTLLNLVDRSMLGRHGDHSLQFRMLDTVREFALERADQLGEREEIEERHASWVARSILNHRLTGEGISAQELTAEIGPALDYLGRHNRSDELTLATVLATWWVEASRIAEGRDRVETALDRHRSAPSRQRAPAEALVGLLAWYQGDGRGARVALSRVMPELEGSSFGALATMAELCLAFIEARFDDAEIASQQLLCATQGRQKSRLSALFMTGNVAFYGGDDALALDRYLQLRTLAESLSDPFQVALAIRFEALARALCGTVDKAWALAERGLAFAEAEGSLVGRTQAQAILSLVAYLAGDVGSALEHAGEATRLSRASLDAFSLRVALPVMSACLADRGDDELAAATLGWLVHLVDDSQLFLAPAPQRLVEETTASLSERLGEPTRRRLFARAARLELRDLVDSARLST